MMYCVGLTGTIASGKSTIAAGFKRLGIDVISADQISRELTAHNQPTLEKIVTYFGKEVLTATGELNRKHLRTLIFATAKHRLWLEKLLHPLIRKQIQRDILRCKSPYCLIEIPLLTSKEQYPYLNRVLLILANPEQQITRLIERDNSTREQAVTILSTQANEITLRNLADDVLVNDTSIDELDAKINLLHRQYMRYATL